MADSKGSHPVTVTVTPDSVQVKSEPIMAEIDWNNAPSLAPPVAFAKDQQIRHTLKQDLQQSVRRAANEPQPVSSLSAKERLKQAMKAKQMSRMGSDRATRIAGAEQRAKSNTTGSTEDVNDADAIHMIQQMASGQSRTKRRQMQSQLQKLGVDRSIVSKALDPKAVDKSGKPDKPDPSAEIKKSDKPGPAVEIKKSESSENKTPGETQPLTKSQKRNRRRRARE
jgi:hypothetical protein